MGKRTRDNSNKQLRYILPIYIPTEEGVGDLVIGNAEVRGSTLVVNFADNLPAEAIRARIIRGELTGMTFTIPPDEAEAAREEEEARTFANDLIAAGGIPVTDAPGEPEELSEEEMAAKVAEDDKALSEELKRLEDG